MSNMSYCRFQNTASDFQDCVVNLRSLDPNDPSENTMAERSARGNLIRLAAELLASIGIEDPEDVHAIDEAIFDLDAFEIEEYDDDY